MKRVFCLLVLVVYAHVPLKANAAVSPVVGGYQVSYDINLSSGTSNGSDIQDILIFEWSDDGDFTVDSGFTIDGRGNTVLKHVIDFEPAYALVIGWGAATPGKGDEKDHLFTLTNSSFAAQITGKKWSEAFPGVPPIPRTGHDDMINLVQAAASGDLNALDAVTEFVQREAGSAAFDPSGKFRVVEWSVGQPIDIVLSPIPIMPTYGFGLLIIGLLVLARSFISQHSK